MKNVKVTDYNQAECSDPGDDCSKTKCCSYFGMWCYEKNQNYGACKDYCLPGIDPEDASEYQTPWSCKLLNHYQWSTNVTLGVSEEEYWLLKPKKKDGPTNDDEKILPRSHCSKVGMDCKKTQCCADSGERCYEKNQDWAGCKSSCIAGLDPTEPWEYQTPWTCNWLDNSSQAGKKDTLFCFCLILPRGYEPKLLSLQHAWDAGIFGCDDHAIYSNETVKVTSGIQTMVIDSNLSAPRGGEFKTALNLDIFITVWNKVILEGRFMHFEWTVKVDADVVFFPDRLRIALWRHVPDSDRGVYLNNCKFGLHGPIEVFSHKAVQSWGAGYKRCIKHFTRLCSGDCKWGEDMFIDQCLKRVIKCRRDDEFSLLMEDHCDPPPQWESCNATNITAFHPFKHVLDYRRCLMNARDSTMLGPMYA